MIILRQHTSGNKGISDMDKELQEIHDYFIEIEEFLDLIKEQSSSTWNLKVKVLEEGISSTQTLNAHKEIEDIIKTLKNIRENMGTETPSKSNIQSFIKEYRVSIELVDARISQVYEQLDERIPPKEVEFFQDIIDFFKELFFKSLLGQELKSDLELDNQHDKVLNPSSTVRANLVSASRAGFFAQTHESPLPYTGNFSNNKGKDVSDDSEPEKISTSPKK